MARVQRSLPVLLLTNDAGPERWPTEWHADRVRDGVACRPWQVMIDDNRRGSRPAAGPATGAKCSCDRRLREDHEVAAPPSQHEVTPSSHDQETEGKGRLTPERLGVLMAVLGVVYGDIGTSPLYAFKASLQLFDAAPTTNVEIMGMLSLIFWSLVLIVTVKYVILVMRADNRGEGGILALMALAQRVSVGTACASAHRPGRHRRRLPVLRRRRHHAGDLGAVGGGGAGGLGARLQSLRAADQRRRDRRAVRRAVSWHRAASAGYSGRSWRCGS